MNREVIEVVEWKEDWFVGRFKGKEIIVEKGEWDVVFNRVINWVMGSFGEEVVYRDWDKIGELVLCCLIELKYRDMNGMN